MSKEGMMKKLLTIFLIPFFAASLHAADIDGYALLRKTQAKYAGVPYLRFDMKYIAAMAANASQQFDSLSGSMAIHQFNYKLVLGNTENVVNDKHMFQVFKDDKMLLVGNRPAGTENAGLPLLALDSNSFKQKGFSLSVISSGRLYKMIIRFPEGLTYKTAELDIDSASGYIQQAKYSIKTEAMMEKEAVINDKSNIRDSYAIVTVTYSNYTSQPFDTSFFQDDHFISNQGNEILAAGAYEGYKIFNVNPKQL